MFQILEKRINAGEDGMLIAVIEKSGSAPRQAGAYMLVGQNGRLWGTIGGGNLEYQATVRGINLLQEKRSEVREYYLGAEKSAELGMICGGDVRVLFYYMDASDEDVQNFVEQGSLAGREQEPYWLLLPLEEGPAVVLRECREAQNRRQIEWNGLPYYAERFSDDGKVYIFGGGHLTQETVPVLSHLGFRCVVIDDREEFTQPELFPGAEAVLQSDFRNLFSLLDVQKEDYIAVMTRGHLCDTEAERFALRTPACYVGVVGSRKKTQIVRRKLMEEGFSEEELDRVVTPIGLDIQAETPAEIAISIAAQLIQVRAAKQKR
ncbi:MAG: XdhC family protein [Clostridiales bacterium]|nr:XdhC family protein [Clostridiales bacterium]